MPDLAAVAMAFSAGAGAWAARPCPMAAGLVLAAAALATRRAALLCAGVALLASCLSARAWSGLPPAPARLQAGVLSLVGDPVEVDGALRVDVRIRGKRVEAWARGRAAAAIAPRLAGERVWMLGRQRPATGRARRWLARRHVGARLSVLEAHPVAPAAGVYGLANRFRRTLAEGARSLPPDRRALFSGFVLGDARDQPVEVADDFRASGLTHLLVVSGENVAFVLALLAPLASRLTLRGRMLVGLAALFAFGVVVRWEPSVLRAAAMAALSMLSSTLGRPASRLRLLALAVTALVLIDPLLVRSAGFLMSVGASAGIAVLAGPLADLLPGPRPLAAAVGVTLAAQVGVAPVSVPLFGGLPVAGVPANLLALPAAGPVMMWGLVAGLPAGAAGGGIARVLHLPTRMLVGWIAGVARVCARLPLGTLGAAHIIALVVLVGVAWAGRGHTSVTRRRLTPALLALILLIPGVSAARPPPLNGRPVAPGAEVWRAGGATVVVVGQVAGASLLDGLRRAQVRRVDLLVLTRWSPGTARRLEPVRRRLRVRLAVGPPPGPGRPAPPWRLVTSPRQVAVGPLTVVLRPQAGRLGAEVGPGTVQP